MEAKATGSGEELYLEGIITLPEEDVEGGLYDPDQMDLASLVENGYLDVNHLMFEHGVREAVIGEPVEVRKVKQGVWARFRLYPTQLAHDIWNYVRERPGILGFSIAGTLIRDIFDRGGKWLFGKEHGGSVAISRFPMNPGTWAVATKAGEPASLAVGDRRLLEEALAALAQAVLEGRLAMSAPWDVWYTSLSPFLPDPVFRSSVASWAEHYFNRLADTQGLISAIRSIVIGPEESAAEILQDLRARMDSWLLQHPRDEHFTRDGRFRTLADAMEHLRFCWRLSPTQTAKLLGFMRGDAKHFIARVPAGWPEGVVAEGERPTVSP